MGWRSARPWLVALVPGAAATAVVAGILASGHPGPRLLMAVLVGFAAAAGAALFSARPWLRRLGAWRARLDAASRRLAELEAVAAGATGIPPEDWIELVAPPADDPRLDEALADLVAALQDEDRLRERRDGRTDEGRDLVRRSRDLVGSADDADEPLGARLSTLLDNLERTATSVREALQGTLPRAISADEVAALLHEHATSAQEALRRAADGSSETEQRLERLAQLARRLETRSREIGQVLIVLNDLTEQTNLLALNAAIIAAQAGEEGKGFGIVADEMRNLSERASSSTKETEILAQTLRDDVSQAARGLAETRDVVRGIIGGVARSAESHATITELAKRSRAAAREGMAAAERQTSELRDLAGRVPALREERLRLERLERESIRPARRALAESADRLEAQERLLMVRDSLRARLESAVRAIREHRGQERAHRARWDENARNLRESGRRVLDALEEGRRRDHLVREVARDVRELAGTADH